MNGPGVTGLPNDDTANLANEENAGVGGVCVRRGEFTVRLCACFEYFKGGRFVAE